MWSYIFYMNFILFHKSKTEYDGMEQHVYNCIEHQNLGWFPSHNSLLLQKLSRNSSDSHKEALVENEIHDGVNSLNK